MKSVHAAFTMDDFEVTTQTSAKCDIQVPVGHLICANKWRNSDLVTAFQGSVQVMYQENLGVLDFYTSNSQGVLYVSEADLVTASGYRRKLAKLRKANKINVLVLFEKTTTSTQYFPAAQKFCALELGFSVLPVTGQKQAGTILTSMVHNESRLDSNPYCRKRKAASLDKAMLDTVQAIPKLGQVKARALLENFQSIHGICQASVEELSLVVGKASAHQVKNFFGDG